MMLRRLVTMLCALLLLGAGCAPVEPRFATGPDGALTEQGLRALERTRFAHAWAKPGVSFERYDRVWLRYRDIAYREPPSPRKSRGGIYGISGSNYALSEDLNARIQDSMREIFAEELAGGGRWQADGSGEDVLDTRVGMIDLEIKTPLDRLSGEDNVYVDEIGAVTIVVDLYDSVTGELVLRVAERGVIGTQSHRPIQASAGPAIYETRRLLTEWATKLRRLLYALRAKAPST